MSDVSRRSFVKKSLAILASVPAVATLSSRSAHAEPTTALDPANPTAVALGYHEDSTKVDAGKFPLFQPNRLCKGCLLYTKGGLKVAGKSGEWGVCTVFPQGLVAANGWCVSWSPKAS